MNPTRISLIVLFYNQEAFAEDAVRSALAQSCSSLEIVLSDDASSDGTFAAIERLVEAYDGPHEVILNRNPRNLGVAGNLNRAMELASGDIVAFTGGDDISMPNRVARAVEVLAGESECLCVSFGTIRFKDDEIPTEHVPLLDVECRRYTMRDYIASPFFHVNGASRIFRRRVFDFFGPIGMGCPTEDSVILLRCFLLGDVLSTPEPQLYYRLHGAGLSQFGNIHRMDPQAIHQQYLRDIAIAVDHGLLTKSGLEQLMATLELRLQRRSLQRSVALASNRLDKFRMIASSEVFGSKEKGRMLFSALRPRRRR